MADILTRGWDDQFETRGWDSLPGLDQEQSDALLKADREGKPFEVTVDNGRMSENKVDGQPMTSEAQQALEAAKYAQAFGEQHAVDVGMEAVKPVEQPSNIKSMEQVLAELAAMPLPERAARLAAGLPVGLAEFSAQFAAQIPQMAFQVGGFAKALSEGKISRKDFDEATASITPKWVSELATGEGNSFAAEAGRAAQPETYAGALISHGVGEAIGAAGRAAAAPAAGIVGAAPVILSGGDRQEAQQAFSQEYEKIAPVTEQVLNAGILGKMGADVATHHAAPKDPLESARPILQARNVDDAIAAAERAINEPEPEIRAPQPETRAQAAPEPPTLDLSQALPEEASPPSPAKLQAGRIAQAADEAIARRAQNDRAAELAQPIEPDESLRTAMQPAPEERPLRSQAEIVQERLDAEERARNAQEAQQAIARGEGRVEVPGGPEKAPQPRTVRQMTVPELDAILRLSRSADRRAEITAELLRRAQEGKQPETGIVVPEVGRTVPEKGTNALTKSAEEANATPVRSDAGQVREGSAEGQPGVQPGAVEGRGDLQRNPEAGRAPAVEQAGGDHQPAPEAVAAEATNVAEKATQDFTTPKGEVKTFTTQKMAQAFMRQNRKVPRDYAPRQVARGQWVLSRPEAEIARPEPQPPFAIGTNNERMPGKTFHSAAAAREHVRVMAAKAQERPALDLKGESESEIKAREAREAKEAETKRAQENAPGPEGFTLTGSDRPADEAEARGQKPMFSRAGRKQLVDVLQGYAEEGDAFRYPKSNAKDIRQLAKDYDLEASGFRASDKPRDYMVKGTFDREHHRLPVIEMRDKDGNYKPYLEMHPDPRSPEDTVVIRINELDREPRGVEGSRVYQAAMSWAINNHFHLNPDTDLLPVNRLRRNEAMISTYLKYGDRANVIAPHREQFIGLLPNREYNALRSKKTGFDGDTGNFTQGVERDLERIKNRLWKATPEGASPEEKAAIWRNNLHNLVVASAELALKRAPELKDIKPTDAGDFENTVSGQRSALRRREDLGALSLPSDLPERGLGVSTLRRSIVALEAQRRAGAAQPGPVEGAQPLQRMARPEERADLLVEGTGRGIPVDEGTARVLTAALGKEAFYRRNEAPPERGVSTSEARLTEQEARKSLAPVIERTKTPIRVHQSVEDLRKVKGLEEAPDDAKGVYHNGMIHVVADAHPDALSLEKTVARHEVTHAGTDALYGDTHSREVALTKVVAANPKVREIARSWREQFGAEFLADARKRGLSAEAAQRELRLTSFEEGLAHFSEDGNTIKGWQSFAAAIQKGLRAMGFDRLADWLEGATDAEAMKFLDDVRRATQEEPQGAGELAPAFSREDAKFARQLDREAEDPKSPISKVAEQGKKLIGKVRNIHGFVDELNPLGSLAKKDEYLIRRYRTLGKLAKIEEATHALYSAFRDAGDDAPNIYRYLTTKDASTDIIRDPKMRSGAERAKNMLIRVGEQLVERGLLPREVFEAHKGEYLPRIYLRHLLGDDVVSVMSSGKKPSTMGYLKARKDIPEDVRRLILGEITDPAYLVSKAYGTQARDIALLDWLREISTEKSWVLPDSLVKWEGKEVTPFWLKDSAKRIRSQVPHYAPEDAAAARKIADRMDEVADKALAEHEGVPEGWKQIPDSPRYGQLRGLIVAKEIYNDIVGQARLNPNDASIAERILGNGGTATKFTQLWKWAKVAANPPAQIRNFISNGIMLHLSGVPFHMVLPRVVQAIKEIRTDGQYWKIAKKYGVTESTFSAQELFRIEREFLDLQARHADPISIARAKSLAGRFMDFTGDVYQLSEAIFKTAKIIDDMKRGMSEKDAVLNAQKWLFDYSLVTPSMRYLRNAPVGTPFITFYMKALPRMLEVATHNPLRFAPYIAIPYVFTSLIANMQDVTNDDVKKLKEALPNWLREKNNALILPMKDEKGRWVAMDYGYFLPWAMWQDLGTDLAQGKFGQSMQDAGIFGGPLPDIISAIKTNKDPFSGKEIVNEYDPPAKQVASVMGYLYNMAAPTWLSNYGFLKHLYNAYNNTVDKYGNPTETKGQAAMRLFGVNLYPINPEQTRAQNIRRMQMEIAQEKRRRSVALRDRTLSAEERRDVARQYEKLIRDRAKQLQQYAQDSRVHPRLRTSP